MKTTAIVLSFFISLNLGAQPNDTIHSFELDSNGVKVYYTADKMPAMSISDEDFFDLLNSKMEWPEVDINCWFDKVFFEIIIYPDGCFKTGSLIIANPMCSDDERIDKMKKELKLNLDEIFNGMPKWIPAEINSQKVAVKYVIPIHVHLEF
jgi:hypothetical protein